MIPSHVIIKLNTYEIIDADKDIYSIIGRREYWPFDRIIMDAYVDQFYRFLRRFQMAETKPVKFFIRISDEMGGNKPFLCWFTDGPTVDSIRLNMINVNSLLLENEKLSDSLQNAETILSLYNDAYFIYNPLNESLDFYNMAKNKQRMLVTSAESLLERLQTAIPAEEFDLLKDFVAGLKNGVQNQDCFFSFDVDNPGEPGLCTYFQSAAIYENGEYIRSCGYLHRGNASSLHFGKMVELDSLTGVMTKSEITSKAINLIDIHNTQDITICIIDVDHFKTVNDLFGHMKGDEVLRRVAQIIEDSVGQDGMVGRIDSDEFMVIFHNVHNLEDMEEILKTIKNNVNTAFPMGNENEPVVSLSMGCASYPKDADNYAETFMLADFALYRAKEKDRDGYIIYDIAKHGGLEVAKNTKQNERIEGHGDMSKGDILCAIMDKLLRGESYPIQKLLDDFIVNFDVHRMIVYVGNPKVVAYMAGEGQLDYQTIINTQDYVDLPEYLELYEGKNELVRNNVESLGNQHPEIYKKMKRQNLEAFIQFKITDKAGNDCVLSMEAVKQMSWNKTNFFYYRLFARILENYDLTPGDSFVL